MRIALALLAPFALVACATPQDAPVVDNRPPQPSGPVALNQPVKVGMLVATPKEVIEDSRCPMNARCIWAGRAIVSTRIDGPGWHETAPLTLGEPYATHGTTITLVSVIPENTAGKPTAPGDYRFAYEGD